ncbi:PucR family transcriptional regulator [Gordonia aichiensis]
MSTSIPGLPQHNAQSTAVVTDEVRAAVSQVGKRLRENESEIVRHLTALMARDIDQLDVDPALVEMLEASVHGNVSTILHVLSNDIPVEHLQPTTAAVEYALRLAQRDVPSNSLVRAYHMGQNEMLRTIFGYVDDLELPTRESLAVMRRISDVISQYIEWITLYVFQAYEDERRRWIGAEGNVLSSRIHEILRTTEVDTDSFERESGYSLEQHHVAAILWVTDAGARDLAVLDRAARSMATRLFAEGPPLITAIDRTTAWVWLPLGRGDRSVQTADVARQVTLPEGVRVALGLNAFGVTGFRRSHEQALAAWGLATMPGSLVADVVGFGDRGVAVVSRLARDLEFTRAWVHEVLGPLAEDSPNAAALRETLSVFFATGESHLHTAERLNLHRNTVKYRVDKAMRDTRTTDRLDLALALTVCEFLGAEVLAQA